MSVHAYSNCICINLSQRKKYLSRPHNVCHLVQCCPRQLDAHILPPDRKANFNCFATTETRFRCKIYRNRQLIIPSLHQRPTIRRIITGSSFWGRLHPQGPSRPSKASYSFKKTSTTWNSGPRNGEWSSMPRSRRSCASAGHRNRTSTYIPLAVKSFQKSTRPNTWKIHCQTPCPGPHMSARLSTSLAER